jgi:hypothetical protein
MFIWFDYYSIVLPLTIINIWSESFAFKMKVNITFHMKQIVNKSKNNHNIKEIKIIIKIIHKEK